MLLALRSSANFHKCLMKGAMSLKQIALACSGTSSKLQRAQRVHRACRIRIHANESATAWADPPRLI